MVKKADQRKLEFRAALGYFGESQNAWAARHGVTSGHMSNYWAGRVSGKLDRLVDEFIAEFRKSIQGSSIKLAA